VNDPGRRLALRFSVTALNRIRLAQLAKSKPGCTCFGRAWEGNAVLRFGRPWWPATRPAVDPRRTDADNRARCVRRRQVDIFGGRAIPRSDSVHAISIPSKQGLSNHDPGKYEGGHGSTSTPEQTLVPRHLGLVLVLEATGGRLLRDLVKPTRLGHDLAPSRMGAKWNCPRRSAKGSKWPPTRTTPAPCRFRLRRLGPCFATLQLTWRLRELRLAARAHASAPSLTAIVRLIEESRQDLFLIDRATTKALGLGSYTGSEAPGGDPLFAVTGEESHRRARAWPSRSFTRQIETSIGASSHHRFPP